MGRLSSDPHMLDAVAEGFRRYLGHALPTHDRGDWRELARRSLAAIDLCLAYLAGLDQGVHASLG